MTDTQPLVLDPSAADIQGELTRIRARGPVTEVVLPGGVPAWSVTDAAVLRQLLTDPRVSKDAHQHWPRFIDGEIGPDWVMFPWVAARNMLTTYGEQHQRLRKLVAPAFTNKRTQALRPRIEAFVTELLDELSAGSDSEIIDLRAGFATELPIRVIGELMGVPAGMDEQLRVHADGILDTSLDPAEVGAHFGALFVLMDQLLQYKRDNPGDDLTSVLMNAHDDADGSRLDEQELRDTLLLIITAGHETTANLLDHSIIGLLTHPEQRKAAIAEQTPWSEVIEEGLRWNAPLAHMPMRFAVEDIDIAGDSDFPGVRINRGDVIIASLAGAGRDRKVHGDNTDVFDAGRRSKEHLAFGYGVHHCLGAPLARLEAAIALPALFSRFPELELAVDAAELKPIPSIVTNGHREIPVYRMAREF
ncbi:cytochrome P450 family protein [Nocardia mikamii]|uniref:cytochrome P450 family protein n=1 Tax=Nocardia mikamii TaxID=508464 RepID=UPI0007A3E390|nr:cytochrome P450 [Nocardia mikamii]